jgi:hypothetical protein
MKKIWFIFFFAPLVLFSIEQDVFEVALGKAGVCLKWSSAIENTSGYFILERSKNGKDFEAMLLVQASIENQNKPEYLETDFEPFTGTSYYRLRRMDRNGKENTSLVRSIRFPEGQNALYAIQNPASSEGDTEPILTSAAGALVVFLDDSGKEICSRVMFSEGETIHTGLALQNAIPPGEYVIAACSRQKYYGARLLIK